MTESSVRNLLVLGGHGVTGRAIVDVAIESPIWRVMTGSRKPQAIGAASHVGIDLLDRANAMATLAGLHDVSAVAFCAYVPALEGEGDPNITMLTNMLDGLGARPKPVDRIILMGGGKSYGPHLGPYRTPARESDPRVMSPIFYDKQQDLLTTWCLKMGVDWTILRPDAVFGPSLGSPMNMITSLAVFAAISRELGMKLRFPGNDSGWNGLFQATDAGLLGRSALWAFHSDSSKGEVFNVINGDQFRWRHLWPELARFFDMGTDEPQPMPLAQQMADKGPIWDAIVTKYGLVPTPLDRLVSWPFVDMLLSVPFDLVQSTIKIRKAGFHDCIDTNDSLSTQLGRLRSMRLIP
ncbi:MAG: SDR family oxidoreductase [Janthinobacterium lividum]